MYNFKGDSFLLKLICANEMLLFFFLSLCFAFCKFHIVEVWYFYLKFPDINLILVSSKYHFCALTDNFFAISLSYRFHLLICSVLDQIIAINRKIVNCR